MKPEIDKPNQQTMFFTSDTHYFHKNIIQFSKRPFNDLTDMHNKMINGWNSKITQQDHVYHLGDFSFGSEEQTEKIISRLNGNKHLIYGNHDQVIRKSKKLQSLFNECVEYKEINIQDDRFARGQLKIVLSHFPFLQWNKSHYGAFALHGHCHGSMKYPWPAKILDVGVDVHNYEPLSLDEVIAIMKNKPIPKIDHH